MKSKKSKTLETAGTFIKRGNDYRHVDCKGDGGLSIGAIGYRRLPVGFGYRGSKFVVDTVRQNIVKGMCFGCGKSGTFAENKISKKIVTKNIKKYDFKG